MGSKLNPLIVSFISGKGSIGKSTLLAILAHLLTKRFSSILIWDNDIYTPIQHILNGVEPNISLIDVVTNNIATHKALIKVTNQIFLVGGSNRFDIDVDLSEALLLKFSELLKDNDFDLVLVDSHSGFSRIVSNFSKVSDINLMFLSDEPTSILDAYGLTKILLKFFGIKNIATIVNNVVDFEDGNEVLNIFDQATQNFLGIKFQNFAIVPYEKELKKYVFNLKDFIQNANSEEFFKSINDIVSKIVQLNLNENILA